MKPEDQNYNSPLFLDCCALVRQVVYDLREDFGFTLGRWNQVEFTNLYHKEFRHISMIFYQLMLNPKKSGREIWYLFQALIMTQR